MKTHRFARLDRGVLILIAIFIIAAVPLFKPWIHGFDTVAYYAWLRSAVVDGDLNFQNEFEHYGYGNERGLTATGNVVNEWAIGSAVLWSPFFLIAHGLSLAASRLGLPVAADGYAVQYEWAIGIGSALYGLAAILLSYQLARKLFSWQISVLATASVWLAGPLIFYMYSHPAMSHANDAFAYALFLYVWYQTRNSTTWKGAAARGAAAGLCALVRQVNAYLVFFVLAEYALSGIQQWRQTRRFASTWPVVKQIGSFAAAWWLVYVPQLIGWRIVFGNWIELNPYAAGVAQGFNWLQPHLLEVLFSTNRGLFMWSPLLLLAVWGWWQLWQQDRRLTLLIVINFALQLYLIASWFAWSGAAAFGQRFFTNMLPAFVLGLAALLTRWQARLALRWLVGICAAFVIWNGLLLVRYAVEDVPRMGDVPLDQLIIGQFTVIPRYFQRVLQLVLSRGL